MTSAPALLMRATARRLNIRQGKLLRMIGKRREEDFTASLLEATRPGDIVWDIGALHGMFTKPLSDRAGPDGLVYAFEPNPVSRARLEQWTATKRTNVVVLPDALGAESGVVHFLQCGGRSRVVETNEAPETTTVPMSTADDVIARGGARPPHVMKIDAEGFELDVLQGMKTTLASPDLRALFLEVHFQLLRKRFGNDGAPATIVQTLRSYGFRTRWADPSHLLAQRPG